MNNRIALVRKEKGLSRALFGKQIGVSGDVVNNLERGRVEIKDHMILLICKEFNVNETWLRTGEGEMFLPVERETDIARLTMQLLTEESDSFKNRLISALARLSEDEWEVIEKTFESVVNTKKE